MNYLNLCVKYFLVFGYLTFLGQANCSELCNHIDLEYSDELKEPITKRPRMEESSLDNNEIDKKLARISEELKANNIKDIDTFIVSKFTENEKQIIFDKMMNAEIIRDSQSKLYAQISAIHGFSYAQQKWSDILVEEKNYQDAAKWCIRSAKNNNSDILTYLYHTFKLSPNDINESEELIDKVASYWKDIYK